MDTLLKLAEVVAQAKQVDQPRKLQTAVYLAQELTGCKLYEYSLFQGRVLSDELDQDLAQLEVDGLIQRSSQADGVLSISSTNRVVTRSWLLDGEKQLCAYFSRLLQEDSEALEAASTLAFFTNDGDDYPGDYLRWFKNLPDVIVKRADEIIQQIPNSN